ncbi:hypothetical protein CHUAL_007315 [Chamberlinius hualienensis]
MDRHDHTGSDWSNQAVSMSEQRFANSSNRVAVVTAGDDCRNVVSNSHSHSLVSSVQVLHSVAATHISDSLKLSSDSARAHQMISVSVPTDNSFERISSSTYEISEHNGTSLNSDSTVWVGNLDQKGSSVNMVGLSTGGQELVNSREVKMKSRSVHNSIASSLHGDDLIHENSESLMHAYIARSLPDILEPQDGVEVHGMSPNSQVQLEVSMNSVQESRTVDDHLIALSDNKSLNTGLLLNGANMPNTSYDKSSMLNISNVYSVAPSQASQALRNHALTLDTSVHTIQSAMMRTNEYDQHSHVNNGGNRGNSLHIRDVSIMTGLDLGDSTSSHLQPNDILTNDNDSLHLSSVDLSSNLMDQMNNLNHLSAQENSCESLKLDCFVETLPCYRCKICPFLSLSKEMIEQHLRNTHSKLLDLNSEDDVHNQERQSDKNESISSNIQRTSPEISSVMTDTNSLSKDVTFICGMCDKLFPYIETCSAHMAVEHNITSDNVQLEPMNQTSLPAPNLMSTPTIAVQQQDQHCLQQHHQPLPSILPHLRPKLSLVPETSSFTNCQESQPVTTLAPTKKIKPAPKSKAAAANRSQSTLPKILPKNTNQMVKAELEIKPSEVNKTNEEIITGSSSDEDEKKMGKDNDDSKGSSKKRGRPKGSKGVKVVAPKKAASKGKGSNPSDTRFKCEVNGCAIRMRSSDNLEYHMRSHAEKGFICPECREKFDNWKTLSIHLWRIHVVDMELYTCDICNYKTYSYGKLINMHRRIHSDDRPFLCDTCGKGFKTSKQLRNHRVIHLDKRKHRNLRSGECEICHRRFSDRRMLRVHNDTVHSKLRPYLCNFCGYAASCRSTLKMHIRQHTGEKPFACEKCEYRTADHNSLRRHKMRHSGEKPYRCPFCPYACIQSSTYKTHLKNKHPGLDEGLMFCCQHCSFRTIKKENFVTHMVDHKIRSENQWSAEAGSENVASIPSTTVSSSNTGNAEVKMEDGCSSFLSVSLSQDSGAVTLPSHMEVIPQYVYSTQEEINQGVAHQVINMENDDPEERFPILAGQLKLGHLTEVDESANVQINSSSQLELECGDEISMHVVDEAVSDSAAHNTLGHSQLMTLHQLSPIAVLPDNV